MPKKKGQGLTAEMVKSTLCSGVKLCALTFTRAKLDVTLHFIQNINLSQNMAATYSVIQPIDCKGTQKSTLQLLVTWWPCLLERVFSEGKLHVHVNKTKSQTGIRTHADSQTHQWGLCWANHRLSVWLMLHCLVPHNYIHNNQEPLRSLAAKSCVPLHNIQALFQNTHNWLKCNQLTETIKVCFKWTAKSASGAKLN